MINRRDSLAILGGFVPAFFLENPLANKRLEALKKKKFRFCLNTSSISGCGALSVLDYINIAAEAGYDGVELWVGDIKKYLEKGGKKLDIRKALEENDLVFENTIGFAPWLAGEEGLKKMQQDMELLASLGCKRIAAPPVGHDTSKPLDLLAMGLQYKALLDIGRQTGVMPQLEFWGASDIFWHLGQAMAVLCASGDQDARFLPDIYHMFRGGSAFEALNMINGELIEIFHFNDYNLEIPRLEQQDKDRVYPGDGVAPIKEILHYLKQFKGDTVLSLELFNRSYWEKPALEVATTGLKKMKAVLKELK